MKIKIIIKYNLHYKIYKLYWVSAILQDMFRIKKLNIMMSFIKCFRFWNLKILLVLLLYVNYNLYYYLKLELILFIVIIFFILFYFILFYFILFYFILFYFILFYFILFYFILFYFILFFYNIYIFLFIKQNIFYRNENKNKMIV